MANNNKKKSSSTKPSQAKSTKSTPQAPGKNSVGNEQRAEGSGQKAPLTLTRGKSLCIALFATAFIVALSAFHLIVRNSDVLFTAQNQSFFSSHQQFLSECMQLPGGLTAYIASFLTQFLYHPALGASIMIAMWVAAMWLSKIAFKADMAWMAVLSIPAVCLLVSVIDTEYWIYYTKQTGYWFYATVGYLVSILLVLAFRAGNNRMHRIDKTILVACTYPFFGWYTLLALLYTAAFSLSRTNEKESLKDKIAQPIAAAILIGIMPLILYRLYPQLRYEDAWTAGLYIFTNDKLVSLTPTVPFLILALIPTIYPFLPKEKLQGAKAWIACIATITIMALAGIWTERSDFQNYNYHAEMRMYRAAEEQDWDKVLDEMADIPGDASRQMVMLKNIALLNKGEMGTKMFRYNNMGEPPANDYDTLGVHMVQTAAPLIYYHHGKTNFAFRWCIENSVEYGYSFNNLKMLARCSLVSGEMDLARKYLTILQSSIYHKEWADSLIDITEKPERIKQHPEFDNVRELRDHMGTVLDGDNGLCEMYLLNYFSNTMNKDSKLLQELTLNYALVQKDIKLFWPRFFLYAQMHQGETMPTHYQEAAYLYGNLEPETVDTSGMPFDKEIPERYATFRQISQQLLNTGMSAPEVGETMKSTYGDTFWWFYFFCRDIHSY